MTIRKNLPPETLQRAVELLRIPQSMETTANQLGVGQAALIGNLKRAGLYEEFRNRVILHETKGRTKPGGRDEGISNKFLKMKLRGANG